MAKITITIPDGEFCSDKHYLGCLYEEHENGLHMCRLFNEFLQPLEEFKVNGERRRAFRKCKICFNSMEDDSGNGIIPDDRS